MIRAAYEGLKKELRMEYRRGFDSEAQFFAGVPLLPGEACIPRVFQKATLDERAAHVCVSHQMARYRSQWADYRDVDYVVSPQLQSLVQPDETTYVEVKLKRKSSAPTPLLNFSTNPDFFE